MSICVLRGRWLARRPTLLAGCFFFSDTATTEIYTLSLHDALPISGAIHRPFCSRPKPAQIRCERRSWRSLRRLDRKSTRLNSSHVEISYAVFCLKKKKRTVPSTDGDVAIPHDDTCTPAGYARRDPP